MKKLSKRILIRTLLISCIIGLSGCARKSVILSSDKLIVAPKGSVIKRPTGDEEIVPFDGVVVSLDKLLEK